MPMTKYEVSDSLHRHLTTALVSIRVHVHVHMCTCTCMYFIHELGGVGRTSEHPIRALAHSTATFYAKWTHGVSNGRLFAPLYHTQHMHTYYSGFILTSARPSTKRVSE